AGQTDRRRTDAGLHRTAAARLPDGRPCARADVALLHRIGSRRRRSFVAAVGCRPDLRTAAERQIEQDGGRHDGDDAARAGAVADLVLLEPARYAAGGIEAVRAAARQRDGVDDLHVVDRIQQISFSRPRRAAADVDAAGRIVLDEHDRTASGAFAQREVADL